MLEQPWDVGTCACEHHARRFLESLQRCGAYPARCVHEYQSAPQTVVLSQMRFRYYRCRHCGQSERRLEGASFGPQ